MAGKADFTEDEWEALQKGVTGAGMLVSVAHRDFTDSFGEANTIATQLAAHRESESQLVRELRRPTAPASAWSPHRRRSGRERSTPSRAAVAVLGEKAPDELRPTVGSCSTSQRPSRRPRAGSRRRRRPRSRRSLPRWEPDPGTNRPNVP